ncbi:helix-turn-helix transcriptional regulator [Chryseobacterium fluminis]|uniref:helix-turn-helix transcriptional regulator n=1 Tax=Chryseobacterium fluminis TaxID=2983606 RepID=UPI002250619A|nr:helix-turn-helix transcriptional regulator [Chryseobacterium sp. MMS21-Ot14]UZT96158.1 helix-turn-helix transcriptional regulator [Chryseobacterium sp. MMS21-Ot14]
MQKIKLREIRKRKGYTQQQVADIIPTDVSNYSRKESGDVRIVSEEWNKIARFLDVPLEDIYEEEEAKIIIENPVINDSPGALSVGNTGNTNSLNINDMSMSLLKHLQDYIELLKKEIDRLAPEDKSEQKSKTSE